MTDAYDGPTAAGIPDHSGTVTRAEDPDTFWGQVEDFVGKVADAINKFIDMASSIFVDALKVASHIPGVLGGLHVPFTHIGVDGVADHLLDDFNAACNKVVDYWNNTLCDKLYNFIAGILGDPIKMNSVANAYNNAATQVSNGAIDLSGIALPSKEFAGDAAWAYGQICTPQTTAVNGVQWLLTTAATSMQTCEASLLNYWNKQLWNLVEFATKVENDSADAGDLGNAPDFEAGPIMKVLSDFVNLAGDLVSEFGSHMVDVSVVQAGAWKTLTAQFGARGLAGGQWPRMNNYYRQNMNSPAWT